MKLVIVESPYAGDIARNVQYARLCVKDSLDRGEAPLASHLLYTQEGILNDSMAVERLKGIEASLAWHKVVDKTVVYTDHGISRGMQCGIVAAHARNIPIEYRKLFPG